MSNSSASVALIQSHRPAGWGVAQKDGPFVLVGDANKVEGYVARNGHKVLLKHVDFANGGFRKTKFEPKKGKK